MAKPITPIPDPYDPRESQRRIVEAVADIRKTIRLTQVLMDECRESLATADDAIGWMRSKRSA